VTHYCRSQWGFCGTGPAWCNDASTWVGASCGGGSARNNSYSEPTTVIAFVGEHHVVGQVAVKGVTPEQFNKDDASVRDSLAADLATSAGVAREDVTIVRVHELTEQDMEGTSGPRRRRRRRLQNAVVLLLVDYEIAFESDAEAQVGAARLQAAESFSNVEAYAAENGGYSNMQVNIVASTVEVVAIEARDSREEHTEEDGGGVGMEIMAGACVAAAVVALAGGYVAFRKRRGVTKQKQAGSSGSVELQNREAACRGFSTIVESI